MIFSKDYYFRIEGKKLPVKVNRDLSLFEACKRTIGVKGSIVLRNGNLVAFFNSFSGLVQAGFEANKLEKEAIFDFHMGV
jgi:hypothetical protein